MKLIGHRDNNNYNQGFTLLETLAAIILIAMILVVAMRLYVNTVAVHHQLIGKADSSFQAQRAAWYIQNQVQGSTRIIAPVPGSTGNRLRLQQGPGAFNQLEFYFMARELWQVKGGGHNPVASNIASISFYGLEKGNGVRDTIEVVSPEGNIFYQGVATIRNEN